MTSSKSGRNSSKKQAQSSFQTFEASRLVSVIPPSSPHSLHLIGFIIYPENQMWPVHKLPTHRSAFGKNFSDDLQRVSRKSVSTRTGKQIQVKSRHRARAAVKTTNSCFYEVSLDNHRHRVSEAAMKAPKHCFIANRHVLNFLNEENSRSSPFLFRFRVFAN